MKKLFFLLVFLTATLAPSLAQGKVVSDSLESTILGVAKHYTVYLPAGYGDSDKDYPVLYLLHGAWGDHTNWTVRGMMHVVADELYAGGTAIPAVIVMPDASGENPDKTGHRMGYFDKEDWKYETHFFEEFIPHIETKYRIRAGKKTRAIAGLSMGGGGSIVYALHRPDMFGSSCSLSGLLGSRNFRLLDDDFMDMIRKGDPQDIIRDATPARLEELRTVRWYIDCGDDDFLARFNVEMYLLMKEKNIPLQYRMRDGGHTWLYWQTALPAVLRFISVGFAG